LTERVYVAALAAKLPKYPNGLDECLLFRACKYNDGKDLRRVGCVKIKGRLVGKMTTLSCVVCPRHSAEGKELRRRGLYHPARAAETAQVDFTL
jgi:hypothetical protein